MQAFSLEGRGIGVTGAGGHLGVSITQALVACGARVVVCGRTSDTLAPLVEAAPGRVFAEVADVTKADDIERVLDRIEREAGQVDGWVNNANSSSAQPFLHVTQEGAQQGLLGSFLHAALATEAAARRMLPRRRGVIINIATMYALVSPPPSLYEGREHFHNPPIYGAAKAALLQHTRYAACHLGAHGIRVNAISPGPFPSPKTASDEGFLRELARRVPLGRVGQPAELGGAVAFLLSDAAAFINGHNLVIDGGWTAW